MGTGGYMRGQSCIIVVFPSAIPAIRRENWLKEVPVRNLINYKAYREPYGVCCPRQAVYASGL